MAGWGVRAQEREEAIPTIYAEAAVVTDASTGVLLYEKNPDEKREVASTQKLLTALLVAEAGDLDSSIKVERTDRQVKPTRLGLGVGREYPRKLLVQSLLVRSGNDVARCLARDHSGGQDDFREAMNARARRLGMGNSHFMNPHGLTEKGQHSTARDMAKLAFVAHGNKHIRRAVAVAELEFPMKERKMKLRNTNQLLHRLSFVTGMKTGYTEAAGRCLISSATYGDREVIAVVLGSDKRHIWEDSETLLRWSLKIAEEAPADPEALEKEERASEKEPATAPS